MLLYEKHFGWCREPRGKLNAYEYKILFQTIDESEPDSLEMVHPRDGNPNLALSFRAGMDLFIALSREKTSFFAIDLDDEFISFLKQFLDAEMDRFLS